jgi:hypothetical protein
MKQLLTFMGLVVIGAALVVHGVVGVRADDESLGGMPSGYPATDYDQRLTGVAREAVPIIATIDSYYARYGHCPRPIPGELEELQGNLTGGFVATHQGQFTSIRTPSMISEWLYYVFEGAGRSCTLSRKLGWDPQLIWERDTDGSHWVFDPGDGSDEKPIRLKLENPAR